ncbi:MAG: HU family DNA-binding protein [Lentisphaeria bacterium]|nr:HU family DNA-binding protein [Lentisphaeria bacterium]
MTKRDLAIRIANNSDINLTQRQVQDVLQVALDTITKELAAGRGIEFRNFGVFELKVCKERVGRNPNAPSNTVKIPERVTVKFKPGKVMKEMIDQLSSSDI